MVEMELAKGYAGDIQAQNININAPTHQSRTFQQKPYSGC